MTKKYDDFMAEFRALLKKHDLDIDFLYDDVIVINGFSPENQWFYDNFEDKTTD